MASEIEALDTDVVAVSADTPEAVRAFAEDEGFLFPLLADTDHAVADRYGVARDGRARRITFVLDDTGIVRHVDDEVRVSRHGPDLVARIRELKR